MEKNWIEEIKEFLRKAMNKGFKVNAYHITTIEDNIPNYYEYRVFKEDGVVSFTIESTHIRLETTKGEACFNINLSKRDLLELDAMVLSIEEYNEDMVLFDINNFFGEENKIVKMEDLDNDEE